MSFNTTPVSWLIWHASVCCKYLTWWFKMIWKFINPSMVTLTITFTMYIYLSEISKLKNCKESFRNYIFTVDKANFHLDDKLTLHLYELVCLSWIVINHFVKYTLRVYFWKKTCQITPFSLSLQSFTNNN